MLIVHSCGHIAEYGFHIKSHAAAEARQVRCVQCILGNKTEESTAQTTPKLSRFDWFRIYLASLILGKKIWRSYRKQLYEFLDHLHVR